MISINTNNDADYKSYVKVGRIYNALKHREDEIIVENLLRTEGDINYFSTSKSNTVPNLLQAVPRVSHSRNKLLELLLSHGADFTRKNNQGTTVVHTIIQEAMNKGELPSQRTFQDECINSILSAHVKFDNPANPCDANGISHFHAACMTNHESAVEFFLENGVDVNQAVHAGSPIFPLDTPLHLAVNYTSPEAMKVLLKYGANVYSKNAAGLNPVYSIIQKVTAKSEITVVPRFVETLNTLIKFIIEDGVDSVNARDAFGFTKFHEACLLGDKYSVEKVLNQITHINQAVNFDSPVCPGYTELHFAAFSNTRTFQLLLEKGADIEAKNAIGQTPFDLCLQNYTVKDIHFILSSRKEWASIVLSDKITKLVKVVSVMEDVDKLGSFLNRTRSASTISIPSNSLLWPGYTLLHLAVIFTKKLTKPEVPFHEQEDDTKIVAECLKRGADMTVSDAKGSTALHLAFYMQKSQVVECLLNHQNTTKNPTDKDNLSHFHIACASGHPKTVDRFLRSGVDINNRIRSTIVVYTALGIRGKRMRHFFICPGSTALHIAVANGNKEITEMLVKNGANVHARDTNGFTPVHRLLTCGDLAVRGFIASSLLTINRLENFTTDCGLSHLHVACYFRHCEAIRKILKVSDPKAIVVYAKSSRVKHCDEVFCDSYGNYREPLSFLSEYNGYTPLDFLWHSHYSQNHFNLTAFWEISFTLIERDSNTFAKNDRGISRLRNSFKIASLNEHDFPYALLKKNSGMQTRLEEEFGITKLHLACYFADVKFIEKLVSDGANVNVKINSDSPILQGHTPLRCTVEGAFHNFRRFEYVNSMMNIIRLLMKYGADLYSMDDKNDTLFHTIQRRNGIIFLKIIFCSLISSAFELVEKFDVNPTNNHGLSIFHIACIINNVPIIRNYLKLDVDVNQAISYFSDFYPGSTPLHLVLKYSKFLHTSCHDETLLQVVDMLIQNGANVNATDAFGETPLFEIFELEKFRQILISKILRCGADVHVTNVYGNTPFELLLRKKDASWEEIELFLNAGCRFNGFNPVSQEGYMAEIFSCHGRPTDDIMGNPVLLRIINDSKITEIDNEGRTALHNIVSLNKNEVKKRFPFMIPGSRKRVFYGVLIEQLLIRGCDIDYEDNEGKTALHLAVILRNTEAFSELLNYGADVNIADKDGKTAFGYCCQSGPSDDDRIRDYDDPNYTIKLLAIRNLYKLDFCGLYVSQQNKQLKVEMLGFLNSRDPIISGGFHEEIEKLKNMKIGKTSISLYDFLTGKDTNIVFTRLTDDERGEFDHFYRDIKIHKFLETCCVLQLKYRQTIESIILVEPALASLNVLTKYQLPDLCCRCILKFLRNQDLKRLIASVK